MNVQPWLGFQVRATESHVKSSLVHHQTYHLSTLDRNRMITLHILSLQVRNHKSMDETTHSIDLLQNTILYKTF